MLEFPDSLFDQLNRVISMILQHVEHQALLSILLSLLLKSKADKRWSVFLIPGERDEQGYSGHKD